MNYTPPASGRPNVPGREAESANRVSTDLAPPSATTFSNATLAYAVNGTGRYATTNSGTVAANHKSGTFSGTDLEGKTVSGSFTCWRAPARVDAAQGLTGYALA